MKMKYHIKRFNQTKVRLELVALNDVLSYFNTYLNEVEDCMDIDSDDYLFPDHLVLTFSTNPLSKADCDTIRNSIKLKN